MKKDKILVILNIFTVFCVIAGILSMLLLPLAVRNDSKIYGVNFITGYNAFSYKLLIDPVLFTTVFFTLASILPLIKRNDATYGFSFLFMAAALLHFSLFRQTTLLKETNNLLNKESFLAIGFFLSLSLFSLSIILNLVGAYFLTKAKPRKKIDEVYCENCEHFYDPKNERCPNCFSKNNLTKEKNNGNQKNAN